MLDHLPSDLSTNRRYFEGFGRPSPRPLGCSEKNRSLFSNFIQGLETGLLKLLVLDETAAPWIATFLDRYRDIGA